MILSLFKNIKSIKKYFSFEYFQKFCHPISQKGKEKERRREELLKLVGGKGRCWERVKGQVATISLEYPRFSILYVMVLIKGYKNHHMYNA